MSSQLANKVNKLCSRIQQLESLDKGATGATGPEGPQGIQGDKGPTGMTGSIGPQGIKGDKGQTGMTGSIGPQGIKGMTGADASGDVNGPTGVVDNRIATFDGTSGKLIKDGTTITAINNTLTGLAGGVIFATNAPQTAVAPTVDNDLTNKLYVDSRVGNLYCMIADGPTITSPGTVTETPLLAAGSGDFVGSLTVPANGFAVGDAFHFVVAGDCVFHTNQELRLRLKTGTIILSEISMDLETTTGSTHWELEADFIIRSLGPLPSMSGSPITGSIISNFDFTFNKKTLKDFKGVRTVDFRDIDTTSSNTLDLTAQFLTSYPSSMTARIAYLKRMH